MTIDGMNKTIYIAGPMARIADLNFPAFYAAEQRLKKLGYTVINPARFAGVFGDQPTGKLLDACCEAELAAIPFLDAIYLLRGWEASKGARTELTLALLGNKEIILEEAE